MPRPRKTVRDMREEMLSAAEAILFLRLSERTFYRLVEDEIIPKRPDGGYVLGEIMDAYQRLMLNPAGLNVARMRLTTAQAELAELELAEEKGDLHRAEAVSKVWSDTVHNAKTKLLAIPAKVSPALVGLDANEIQGSLKKEIYEVLNELAEYNDRRIRRASTVRGK